MIIDSSTIGDVLDEEWVELIFKARDLGITIEEVQVFLSRYSSRL